MATKILVDQDSTEQLDNKTVANTCTVNVKDTLLTLQDNSDTTKQAQFECSGITAGQTRTLTIPDANLTLVGTATTQTLTNKTLDNTTTLTVKDANLTIQDDADTTKQAKFQASGITTGTTRTVTLPDKNGTLAMTSDIPGASGMSWSEVTGTTQSATVNNGYIVNNASQVTVTLPTTAALGDAVEVVGKGAGGWKVAQNASQVIHFGASDTTTGTGGHLQSTHRYDQVRLRCITANTNWAAESDATLTVT